MIEMDPREWVDYIVATFFSHLPALIVLIITIWLATDSIRRRMDDVVRVLLRIEKDQQDDIQERLSRLEQRLKR